MSWVLPAFAIAVIILRASSASTEFASVETEKVPVERLLKNLESVVQKEPENAQAILNFARAHALAYSLRSEEVVVASKYPNLVWFGHEEDFVPFRNVSPTTDPEKLKVAKVHLTAALKLYDDAIKVAPNDRAAQLGHAWLLTQTENKADAVAPVRKVIEKAGEKEKDAEGWGPGGLGIVVEAARYLLPLLDAGKDKAEIATLQERVKKMESLPRAITPIAVPLKPGLSSTDLEDRSARIRFDVDGSGLRKEWTWTTREAAWLVHDPKRSGKITSGLQLLGNVTFWTFWKKGYDALAALDDNPDGQLTGANWRGSPCGRTSMEPVSRIRGRSALLRTGASSRFPASARLSRETPITSFILRRE